MHKNQEGGIRRESVRNKADKSGGYENILHFSLTTDLLREETRNLYIIRRFV